LQIPKTSGFLNTFERAVSERGNSPKPPKIVHKSTFNTLMQSKVINSTARQKTPEVLKQEPIEES
jgi:hypothetical protein